MKALPEELERSLYVLNEAGLAILLRFAPFKEKILSKSVTLEAELT
jgi:hypothetical protein